MLVNDVCLKYDQSLGELSFEISSKFIKIII